MDVCQHRGWVPANGNIVIENLDDVVQFSKHNPETQASLRRSRYTWEPPPEIADQLPQGFSLSFECLAGGNGVRRFVPSLPVPAFILQASLGGSAFLGLKADLSAERRFGYHAMRLIYQQAPQLREHLARPFHREQDLYTPRAGRIGQEDRHILPADLGLDARGRGQPWKPSDLVAEGRAEAVAAGDPNPAEADCIRLGLAVAARRHPLKLTSLSKAESRQLVRLALFDLGPSTGSIQASVIATIQERLLTALERHLEDDSASFNRWFFEKLDNLVHLIAKKKRGGGKLSRDIVRQAHLEMVFRAFTYVGDCVHVQMQAFSRALPEALTAEERALFASLYRKDLRLGGLPLILLHERFGFVREAILDIWEQPRNRRRVGTLLRLLHYYADMASKKRDSDRRYKQQSRHRNQSNRSAVMLPLDADRDAARLEQDQFQEIAAVLRKNRGDSCRCGTTREWHAKVVEEKTTSRVIVLDDGCGTCGETIRVKVPVERFREIGNQVMPD